MRIRVWLWVTASLMLCGLNVPAADEEKAERYVNREKGFSIAFPKDKETAMETVARTFRFEDPEP